MDPQVLDEVIVQLRTLDDAARQGMIKSLDLAGDGDTEYGGIIFQDPQTGMYYMAGGGPNKGQKDSIYLRGTRRKADDKLAGAYHTHPPADKQGMFSGEDAHTARTSNIPLFMGQAANRQGHVYDPARESPNRRQRGSVRTGGNVKGKPFMPGMLMVREDPSVLDKDKAARLEAEKSAALVAEILRKPRG